MKRFPKPYRCMSTRFFCGVNNKKNGLDGPGRRVARETVMSHRLRVPSGSFAFSASKVVPTLPRGGRTAREQRIFEDLSH
jgi:hypothetical protein